VLYRGPLLAGLRMARAQDRTLGPPLEQTLHLLLSDYAEDVLQLVVHLADPVGRGRGQSIQERIGHDQVLADPNKGWRRCTFMVDGGGSDSGPSSGLGEVDGGGSLRPQRGLASVKLDQLGVEGCLLAASSSWC
jgi:hypothetical protein